MAEKEKYYIIVQGQTVEVGRELYEVYEKGRRKERYFMNDLKRERTVTDGKTGQTFIVPGREDSYERLVEAGRQFVGNSVSVEDNVVRTDMLKRLDVALQTLTDEETWIIYVLYCQETSVLYH